MMPALEPSTGALRPLPAARYLVTYPNGRSVVLNGDDCQVHRAESQRHLGREIDMGAGAFRLITHHGVACTYEPIQDGQAPPLVWEYTCQVSIDGRKWFPRDPVTRPQVRAWLEVRPEDWLLLATGVLVRLSNYHRDLQLTPIRGST